MKPLRYLFLAVLLLALVPGVVLAGNHQHEQSGVQVDVPDNWKTQDDENSLGTVAPDESVAIAFLVLDVDSLDAALDGVDEALDEMFDDIELGESEKSEINGLACVSVSATATSDGDAVDLGVALIDTDSDDNILMVVLASSGDVSEEVGTQAAAILMSIRPIWETLGHAPSGLQCDVPFDWDGVSDDDNLVCGPSDGSLALTFHVLSFDSLEAALEELEDVLDEGFDDWSVDDEDEPTEFTVNGMSGVALDGEAKLDGNDIDLGVALILSPKGKVLLITGVAARGHWEHHEGTVRAILQSIRPAE